MLDKLIPGSLERIVLEKLIEKGEEGVTRFDFPEYLGLDEQKLAKVIERLKTL